jgi:hypothetical protein
MSSRSLFFWAAYFVFAACALYFGWHGDVLGFGGPLGAIKLLVWTALLGFLAYSVYCSARENLFESIPRIFELHWGRQVGADLYLGLLVALFVVYLHEGALAALFWAAPTLLFANLSILLYLAIHFEAIVARFLA